ncbi:MAG TPA: FAD-binding and (Fe-S)-binding domain-containing protein [Phycisphaerae bacterium]|nr:FAD-binding and (Fe-S)-binding domain-containing protein [Phycisphaerae bacterium]
MTDLVHLRQLVEQPRVQRQDHEQRRAKGKGFEVDAGALAARLADELEGEVRFDRGSRALYCTDGSNYRQVPIGVVLPKHARDVIRTVAACRDFGAPLFSRGGGTSLAGQSCNVAVCMDFSKYMNAVVEIDTARKLGRVLPGCVLDDLRTTARKKGLMFGPDPATHTRCTLGGMLGNNSCGSHSHLSQWNGLGVRTSDNTHELEVLTYDGVRMRVGPTSDEELESIIRAGGRRGEIYAGMKAIRDKYGDLIRQRYPKIPRRVSGYNLDELLPEKGFHVARALVGTESTCVTILEATMHLVPNPEHRSLLVLGFEDIFQAGDHATDVLEWKPLTCEGVDRLLFEWEQQRGGHGEGLKLLPKGHAWLYLEFGGSTKEEADANAKKAMEGVKKWKNAPSMKLFDDKEQEETLWQVREGSLGATAWVPGRKDSWEGWEDSAVPPDRVGDYLRDFRKLLQKFNYDTSIYGHLGQGCVHCRIPFDFYTAEGVKTYKNFVEEASDLVMKYGGSFSGEHGDGQSRAELLPKMFGEELINAFREFKRLWDPQSKMNPGKVVDPYRQTDNLRLGPDYNPPQPETHFHYPTDKGSWSRAILRCVGIGACRNHGGQTMCPSYMVTREEEHSTRGRARLLWEMMNGDVIEEGWKSEEVKDSLDLCLSCKGCKHDCPVNVDMATYKAEFLSHYYEGKIRPRHAFAFGFIHVTSVLASKFPAIANLFTQTPLLRNVAKFMAGMEQKRSIPPFAPQSFKDWFRKRPPRNVGKPTVMLFADTFNNYYKPETSKAAVEVLEDAGFHVHVPMADMCCGRPLYDYGFVPTAKRWAMDLMIKMQREIEAGLPVVVLEPSCAAVFRDEITNLFPQQKLAQQLEKQTFVLSEFLEKHAPNYRPPRLLRKALLHGHCHHKAIMHMDDEKALLKKMGLDFREPEDGCCGMAGAFGYEKGDHYKVSIGAGERVLLPEVRNAAQDELIITDGFSCREQIEQETDRHALHLADVLAMAIRHGEHGVPGLPERELVHKEKAAHRRANLRAALAAGTLLAAGAAVWWTLKQSRPKPPLPAARR